MKAISYSVIFLFILIPFSCSEVIEFSPYDADVKSKNLNQFYTENLNIHGLQNNDTITFVLLSDPHFYYDVLSKAVKSINTQTGISFVVVCGDITDAGLSREYEYYWKQVRKLNYPVVTIIGNHDFLSTGEKVFKRLFGDTNFSFVCGNYKFIAFNDVVWENENVSPDFEWFNNEVVTSSNKCILFSHIPPWTDQFTEEYKDKFYNIASHQQVKLSVHGHQHHYNDTIVNNKRYIVTEAVYEHEYYLVHLFGENAKVEKVNF